MWQILSSRVKCLKITIETYQSVTTQCDRLLNAFKLVACVDRRSTQVYEKLEAIANKADGVITKADLLLNSKAPPPDALMSALLVDQPSPSAVCVCVCMSWVIWQCGSMCKAL
jgi:hypothetical protein